VLATLFQDSSFDLGRNRDSSSSCINYWPLHHTGLMYGWYGAPIEASFGEMHFFVHGVTLQGSGEQLTNGKATPANVGGLLCPDANLKLRFRSGFEHLALKIEADALARKLGAITGAALTKPILFELNPKFNHPAARRLRRLMQFLVEELSLSPEELPAIAIVEAEQAMMTSFLLGNPSNYSRLLERRPPSAAPWQVRRVEEYIAAHWDQPLTIERLAALTGASARSLFHTFKRARGYSPMTFLKQVRLRCAWQMLSSGDPETTVTAVAFACGFGNLGHFAKYFRTKFGETPSAVLSRSESQLALIE
jgi:AraC-like DNA-binding protein